MAPTMGSTQTTGPTLFNNKLHTPRTRCLPDNVIEVVQLISHRDTNVEGLTKAILEVCPHMSEERKLILRKETVATKRVVIVDQGAKRRNTRNIHPVIDLALDHIPIPNHLKRERKRGDLYHQVLLHLKGLIRKNPTRLMLTKNLHLQETGVLRALAVNLDLIEHLVLPD